MKEELKKLYNQRKDLEVKLENIHKMEYLREGRKWHEKMFKLADEVGNKLKELNKKIEFIENLSLEMNTSEMFYKKK